MVPVVEPFGQVDAAVGFLEFRGSTQQLRAPLNLILRHCWRSRIGIDLPEHPSECIRLMTFFKKSTSNGDQVVTGKECRRPIEPSRRPIIARSFTAWPTIRA